MNVGIDILNLNNYPTDHSKDAVTLFYFIELRLQCYFPFDFLSAIIFFLYSVGVYEVIFLKFT